MGCGPLSTGPFNPIPADNIPPPPDGSGIVAAHASAAPATELPPPPDGSGVAPGLENAPDTPTVVQADQLSPDDTTRLQELYRTGSADQIAAFLHSRGRTSDPAALADYVAKRSADPKSVGYDPSYEGEQVKDTGGVGAAIRGAADTLSFGTAPKIAAAAKAVGQSLSGEGSFSGNYARDLDTYEAAGGLDEQNHPMMRIAGQLLGGLALPSGLEGVGLKAGTDVLRAGGTMVEARVAARVAVRNRMAAVGGGFGAAHGAGSADNLTDAATGALTEGGLGAATGGLTGALGAKMGQRASTAVSGAQDVAQAAAGPDAVKIGAAAARQGIDLLPADVGNATVRRLTAGVAQTPFGAAPIAEAAQRMTDQAQGVRDRVAAAAGQALAPEQLGQNIASGAKAYIAQSGAVKDGLYRAAENAAGDTKIAPKQAVEALDAHISDLAETPGGAPGLQTLQGLRDALSQGDVSVGGLRRMRTVLRDQFVKDGLTGSDIERRVNGVLDASRNDLTQGLQDAGKPQAAALFAKADQAYRERAQNISDIIQPLIGTREKPKSAEDIASALTRNLRTDNGRAVKLLNLLPTEEQSNTRASIIGQLGRVSAGADNPDGDRFSLPAFLTAWNKIGDTAKRAYFGSEGMAALNDVAHVADATKLAQKYANHSNTSGGLEVGRLLTAVTALPTLGASVGGQYAMGRLLAHPGFARWLARAPKTSLSVPAYLDRLSRIARSEPAIANEVLQLQQRLTDAFAGSPTRMAADERRDEVGGAQGNASQQQAPAEGAQP
jgi:hypothetical protein